MSYLRWYILVPVTALLLLALVALTVIFLIKFLLYWFGIKLISSKYEYMIYIPVIYFSVRGFIIGASYAAPLNKKIVFNILRFASPIIATYIIYKISGFSSNANRLYLTTILISVFLFRWNDEFKILNIKNIIILKGYNSKINS
jgi:hypothetical protein